MSVFESDGNQSTQNALEALVGEGKKFRDVEDLAKGKLESDNYIEQLKAQLAEAQTKATEAKTVEELLAKINEQRTPPVTNVSAEANQPAKPAVTADDLAEKVREELSKINQTNQVAQNVAEVTKKLLEVYGTEDAANAYIKARATELGVSVDFLQDVAAKSPKAFYDTIKLEQRTAAAGPTHGNVNPAAFQNNNPNGGPKPNTYKFYQELRKANPALYQKPETQMKMHQDAIEKGPSFYE